MPFRDESFEMWYIILKVVEGIMAGFDDILREVQIESLENATNPSDIVRKKYMKHLHEVTGRSIIAYYSGFQQKTGLTDLGISDSDMQGFMNAVKGLDRSMGLDLILHTPGGDPSAAESIVDYLRDMFNNDIRVIVPHMAMSAGTMIACSAKTILMGKHSSLGPIDPQILGQPAFNLKREFEEAEADLVNHPEKLPYWSIRLSKMPIAVLQFAENAINLSEELITKWLGSSMFDSAIDKEMIEIIAQHLNSNHTSFIHSRHFNYQRCKEIGLKIELIEEDHSLQEAVLSLHHAMLFTLANTSTFKVIENSLGKAFIRQQVTQIPFANMPIQQELHQVFMHEDVPMGG